MAHCRYQYNIDIPERVHSARGFIEEDDLTSTTERYRNGQLPHHASTQLARRRVSLLKKCHVPNRLVHVFLRLFVRGGRIQAFDSREELNVFSHR